MPNEAANSFSPILPCPPKSSIRVPVILRLSDVMVLEILIGTPTVSPTKTPALPSETAETPDLSAVCSGGAEVIKIGGGSDFCACAGRLTIKTIRDAASVDALVTLSTPPLQLSRRPGCHEPPDYI